MEARNFATPIGMPLAQSTKTPIRLWRTPIEPKVNSSSNSLFPSLVFSFAYF
jgi:hypothetical protein